jgi:hypothetical protein
MEVQMSNKRNNGNGNGFNQPIDVDFSQSGAMVPMDRLRQMLANSQSGTAIQPTVVQPQSLQAYTDQVVTQPTTVYFVQSPVSIKTNVPEINIPYTNVWKAHRLHPQNTWRFLWYPVYFVSDVIKTPIGVGAVSFWLLVMLVNFLLNGSYQGPGYASGKKIEVVPRELPNFVAPVVNTIE